MQNIIDFTKHAQKIFFGGDILPADSFHMLINTVLLTIKNRLSNFALIILRNIYPFIYNKTGYGLLLSGLCNHSFLRV
jgi:hypothetical protein